MGVAVAHVEADGECARLPTLHAPRRCDILLHGRSPTSSRLFRAAIWPTRGPLFRGRVSPLRRRPALMPSLPRRVRLRPPRPARGRAALPGARCGVSPRPPRGSGSLRATTASASFRESRKSALSVCHGVKRMSPTGGGALSLDGGRIRSWLNAASYGRSRAAVAVYRAMYFCYVDESGRFEAPNLGPDATPLLVVAGVIVPAANTGARWDRASSRRARAQRRTRRSVTPARCRSWRLRPRG